jgi:hypothetical protein
VKSKPGPAATLGSAAGAGVRLITWCRDYSHQVERDSLRWLLGTVPLRPAHHNVKPLLDSAPGTDQSPAPIDNRRSAAEK